MLKFDCLIPRAKAKHMRIENLLKMEINHLESHTIFSQALQIELYSLYITSKI